MDRTISLSLWTIADMDLPFSSSFHRVKFEQLTITLLPRQRTKRQSTKCIKKVFNSLGGRCALPVSSHNSPP